MRIPNEAHESGAWRIHEIAPDFTLEDVWALPAHGDAGEFETVIALLASADPAHGDSLPARALWDLRDRLGNRRRNRIRPLFPPLQAGERAAGIPLALADVLRRTSVRGS